MAKERPYKGKSIVDFPTQYTIIDIETTGLSPEYDEIIELAAVKVREGMVTEAFSSLVKPVHKIDDFITSLTGITNEMLSTAPNIATILPRYLDFISNDILIGHNVNFDINFLYDYAESILCKPLNNNFVDTMRIFRKLHPELKHHRLADLSKLYNIEYSKAHRSLADCKITLAGYINLLDDISNRFSNTQDFVKLFQKKHSCQVKACDIAATTTEIDEDNPLFGKVIVFTGVLERMVRKDAMQIVANHGGVNGDNVTKQTNYLVLGNNDYCKSIRDGKSTKHKKAEKLKLSGQDIEIISESVFYDMIE